MGLGRSAGRTTRTLIATGATIALLAAAFPAASSALDSPRQTGPGEPFVDVSGLVLDQARQASSEPSLVQPDEARGLLLDRAAMASTLALAPVEGAGGSLVLQLPAPDDSTATFDIWESAIMAPELAAQFPEIKTYAGQGIDDPAATIVFDLTPHGFHAQVLSPSGSWYIDPAIRFDDQLHVSYYRDDLRTSPHGGFIEENADEIEALDEARPEAPEAERSGTQLRTHRLAVAANANYSTFHGGTVPLAQAAIVTAINRVTGIYEVEVAVRLQLVANNSSLVFTSAGVCTNPPVNISSASGPGNGTTEVVVTTVGAHGLAVDDVVQIAGTGQIDGKWAVRSVSSATQYVLRGTYFTPAAVGAVGTSSEWNYTTATCDPFTNDSSSINVNQAVVDRVIGDANYDIGHVFTTGSGGLAGLGVVGVSDNKARGTTGLGSPTADKFYVDYVAHEMGHQYGGSHTWNGTRGSCSAGNWGGSVNGLETGSGSTIQAYAGICSLDDLQNLGQAAAGDSTQASDPYFHSRSFDQIIAHTTGGSPGDLGAAPTGNSVPVANAGSDVTVPAQTPFFLTASATDGDPDVLTYNWEQRDGGLQRALDNPQITAGPLFRSFLPTTDGTRYFPRLSDVASGNTNQNGACPALNGTTTPPADCWSQFLIQTAGPIGVGNARALNFRATVRDNRAGGGGVDTDDAVVTVHNTGTKFVVTSPNAGVSLSGNQTVTWNVAGTTAAPISAATVSIRLSTDGGLTFPTELVADTPNDGSEGVILPNINSSTARIMVHTGSFATGAGFFDISDVNFTITPGGHPNDDAASATDLVGMSGSVVGSNVGATGEGGEVGASCAADAPFNSVWWSWTAPVSGTALIDTNGSSFDTVLTVYTGTTLPALIDEVACDDDGGTGLQSSVNVAVTSGSDYLIRVDGFGVNTGAVTLNYDVNDNVANAAALVGNSGSVVGGNVGSTGEGGEVGASCAGDSPFNSVWWSWTPSTSGTANINTVGSDFDTVLTVYTGTTLPALIDEIACNDDTGVTLQSSVNVAVTSGSDYLIRVDGWQANTGAITLTYGVPAIPAWPDFNGNSAADRSVWRPSVGGWYVFNQPTQFLGLAGDIPVPGNYDGDNDTERAVFRSGAWFIQGQPTKFLGVAGDVPVPGDYDGDGDTEVGVYRNGAWFVEGQMTVYFGAPGDVPVPADYNGDGTVDRAVFRPAVGGWYVHGQATVFFGLSSDVPVPGDYDGDGTAERAVYRPAYGAWFVEGQTTQYLGLSSDVVVPADYDGDGTVERAVFRPNYGAWYVAGEVTVFYGLSTDRPVPIPAAMYKAYYTP